MIRKLLGEISAMRAAFLVALILISNVLELVGMSLFIPIIDLFQAKGGATSGITQAMSNFLDMLGLTPSLGCFLSLLCLLFLFKGVLTLWMRHESVKMAADVQNRLRLQIYGNLLNATAGFVQEQKQGALLSVMGEHTVRVGQILFLLLQMAVQWVTVLAYLAFVLWISWKLTLVALALGAVLAPAIRWMGIKAHRHGKEYTQYMEETQHQALEGMQAKKLVNAMNWGRTLGQRHHEASTAVRDHWQWMAFWSNAPGVAIQPISIIILSLIIWMSLRFDLSVALLGAFALAFTRLLPAVQTAIGMGADVQANKSSMLRVYGLLENARTARESGGNAPFQGLKQAIRLEGVCYRYPGREQVLTGIDLAIPKGSTVALVGRSGAGKTTIADLIVGLYRPEAGRIMIDDTDLADLDLPQYRNHIAYVTQEPVLFHDTLRNNLMLGLERSVDEQELQKACEQAGAWEFITRRPEGMYAIIGDRGVQLSGGQRQRLALARALLRHPEILILDEATSALDQESEHWVAQTLRNLKADGHLTIIVIAHRYTTIQHADQIIEVRGDSASVLGNWEQAQGYLTRESQALTIS